MYCGSNFDTKLKNEHEAIVYQYKVGKEFLIIANIVSTISDGSLPFCF